MATTRQRPLGQLLVGNLLATSAARFPEREALYCVGTGRRLSFRELEARTNRLAHALLSLSLPRGTVVAFLCSNRAEIVETYFALAKTGLIGLPLNYRLAPAEIAALIEAMGATVLICEARFAGVREYLEAHAAAITRTIWVGGSAAAGYLDYEKLIADSAADEPDVEIDQFDPYYFNLTSGTTGLPKSYVLTQYNVATINNAMLAFGMRSDDVLLTVFPAFGRVGFGWVAMSIALGARNVLMDFDPATFLRMVREESVTFTNLVPTMAAMLLAMPELEPPAMASLRAIAFVGAMLPPTIRNEAVARLCPCIYEGYGLQEIGWLTVSTPEDRARRPDSVGRPILFADVRVVDTDDRPVAAGEIGEIIGRSPNGITSYFDGPPASSAVFRNGWFHTGDLGRLDEDGYLYICGRVKDMIISGGQNVHAAEIEAALLAFPGIADCAVIGLPDATWGERVAAVIVSTGAPPATEAVQDFCRARLAGFKVPKQVYVQKEPLPRTPTGKIQKFLLVERYGGKR